MTSLQQTAMGGGSATAKTVSYTLVAADAGTTVIMNSASSTTITVNTALFAAGDTVLIVNQGAGVCTVTAGTATVSTAGSLALSQYETGQLYFLSASAAIFTEYVQTTATAKILQVVSATKTDTSTTTSQTFVDISGLSLSITPTSATSKILIQWSTTLGSVGNASGNNIRLMRDSTAIGIGDAAGSRPRTTGGFYPGDVAAPNNLATVAGMFLDSPATTSATTYKIQFANANGSSTIAVNRTDGDRNFAGYDPRAISTITVMEVGA